MASLVRARQAYSHWASVGSSRSRPGLSAFSFAKNPCTRKDDDSAAIGAWRERMGCEEAKAIYKERAATAECVNGLARERGLTRLRVRGTAKVRCVLLLHMPSPTT